MRSAGSSDQLECRRQLAVQRVLAGYPIEEVADFLGVHRTTVSRWVAAFRAWGTPGLAAHAPHDTAELDGRVVVELTAVKDDQQVLQGLYHASELPLPRALLF